MMSTEKKVLIEFLKLYKESPCLWDQTHSLYTNKDARNQAYNVLLDNFKSYQKDASMENMKKKLENMRTTCKREYKKIIAARIKGYDHRPTLWYYDLMSFIHNEDDDNPLDYTEGEDIEGPQQCEYEEYEEDESKPKRLKITEVFQTNQSNNVDTISKYTNDSIANRRNDEESMAFGRTVGLQLKELDNYQRIIAEKLISDTVFYARLNKLTTKTTIDLN